MTACGFCAGAHRGAAVAFGIDPDVFDGMMRDVERAPVDDKLKPILAFVRKLTQSPAKIVQADADAVFAAGWDEAALSHAINVSALFNYFNRVVDGHGLAADAAADSERGKALASMGYLGMHGPRLRALLDD